MHRAAAVQAKFRSFDYDEDGVMEYAASILSTPGSATGFTGRMRMANPTARLAPKSRMAAADGYQIDGVDQEPEPYLGYYFRILTKQGAGGAGRRL